MINMIMMIFIFPLNKLSSLWLTASIDMLSFATERQWNKLQSTEICPNISCQVERATSG